MKQLSIDASQDYALALSTLDDDCWSDVGGLLEGAKNAKRERNKSEDIYDEMMSLLESPLLPGGEPARKHKTKTPRPIAPRPARAIFETEELKQKGKPPISSNPQVDLKAKRTKIGQQLLALAANDAIDAFAVMCANRVLATADSFIMSHMEDALRSLPGDNSKLIVLLSIHASLQQHIAESK